MDLLLKTALWQQFGAAIDMLENAMLACPDTLWQEHLWGNHSNDPQSSEYAAIWSITHHTLFWLDLYLTGSREAFAPPHPYTWDEQGVKRTLPEQPYTREELHTYLVQLRQKCQTTIAGLTDEQARQPFTFPWPGGQVISFLELQFCTMRHVQEHTAQISLFLGNHGISDEALDWIPQAKDEPGS
jgi:hypothetical protein